mgnify:CR=1 FL=1
MTSDALPFIDDAAIAGLDLTPDEAREALVRVYRLNHAGKVVSRPKTSLDIGPGHMFQAMCAGSEDLGLATVKWLGVAPRPAGDDRPGIHALSVLNDFSSGAPLAIMDANAMTGLRTAAMSALAAQYLARRESATIGFVGSGLQARTHLEAMRALCPGLRTALCSSRSEQSAARLAEHARGLGMEARAPVSPEEAVRGSDIVVTTVPASPGLEPFLDPAWLAPGAFVAAVDVGRSWLPEGLGALDLMATDDREQHMRYLDGALTLHCDLSELAAGIHPGRTGEAERAMFVFRGHAPADLAISALIWSRYRAAMG